MKKSLMFSTSIFMVVFGVTSFAQKPLPIEKSLLKPPTAKVILMGHRDFNVIALPDKNTLVAVKKPIEAYASFNNTTKEFLAVIKMQKNINWRIFIHCILPDTFPFGKTTEIPGEGRWRPLVADQTVNVDQQLSELTQGVSSTSNDHGECTLTFNLSRFSPYDGYDTQYPNMTLQIYNMDDANISSSQNGQLILSATYQKSAISTDRAHPTTVIYSLPAEDCVGHYLRVTFMDNCGGVGASVPTFSECHQMVNNHQPCRSPVTQTSMTFTIYAENCIY